MKFFSNHTFKVILAFTGMILFGLIMLVVMDSLKQKQIAEKTNTIPSVQAGESVNAGGKLPPVTSTPKPTTPKTTPR